MKEYSGIGRIYIARRGGDKIGEPVELDSFPEVANALTIKEDENGHKGFNPGFTIKGDITIERTKILHFWHEIEGRIPRKEKKRRLNRVLRNDINKFTIQMLTYVKNPNLQVFIMKAMFPEKAETDTPIIIETPLLKQRVISSFTPEQSKLVRICEKRLQKGYKRFYNEIQKGYKRFCNEIRNSLY